MREKQLGGLVLGLGIVAVLIATLADTVGIGAEEAEFGWKQGILLGAGILAIVVGGLAIAGVIRFPEARERPPADDASGASGAATRETPPGETSGEPEQGPPRGS
jgi:hypothetical protein